MWNGRKIRVKWDSNVMKNIVLKLIFKPQWNRIKTFDFKII